MDDEAIKLIEFLVSAGYPMKRGSAGNVLTLCPAHEDSNPSLSIGVSSSGKLLLKCFAGCSFNRIMTALRDMGYNPHTGTSSGNTMKRLLEANNKDWTINKRLGLQILQHVLNRYPYPNLLDRETIAYIKSRRLHVTGLSGERVCRSMWLCSSTVLWRLILQNVSTSEIAASGLGWWRGQHINPCSALKPHRMVIPYIVNGEIIHFSSRAIYSDDPVRYASPPGWGSEAYPFLSSGANMAFIVEGEIKAGVLHHIAGMDTISIPGVDRAHQQVIRICKDRNIQPFILFDKEYNPAVWRARTRFCNELNEHGIMAIVIDLPIENNGERIAPDDLLLEVGRETFGTIISRAVARALESQAAHRHERESQGGCGYTERG